MEGHGQVLIRLVWLQSGVGVSWVCQMTSCSFNEMLLWVPGDHLAGLCHCCSLALVKFPLSSQMWLLSSPWPLAIHPLVLVVNLPVIFFWGKPVKRVQSSLPSMSHLWPIENTCLCFTSCGDSPRFYSNPLFRLLTNLASRLTFPDMSHILI